MQRSFSYSAVLQAKDRMGTITGIQPCENLLEAIEFVKSICFMHGKWLITVRCGKQTKQVYFERQ
jgi:hypothetical protein